MKKYNKKIELPYGGIIVLILPLLIILLVYIFSKRNIFDNPDFWYGYMTYFGTAFLAIVSLIQSVNADEINHRQMEQQLRQKIGYFELEKETEERKYISPYQRIQVGDHFTALAPPDPNDTVMSIWMRNIGEDIILNLNVLCCTINQEEVSMSCSINTIYKNEKVSFDFDCKKYLEKKCLHIELFLQMNNVAGVTYNQNIYLDIEKENIKSKTYLVRSFGTDIKF